MSAPAQESPVEIAARALGLLATKDEPVGVRTTYRSGGRAALFVTLEKEHDLLRLASAVQVSGVEVLVIGNGSNLLVAERGFPGLVVTLGQSFDWVRIETGTITAGGATSLPVLARQAAAQGRISLAWAVGIPGSVGGAVAMNAGGHGADTASTIVEARVAQLNSGEIRLMERDELDFSYRHSRIASTDVVLEATFEAPPDGVDAAGNAIDEVVRWRRQNQPGGRNAGSVFQNPEGDSAGRIIDELGLKGFRVGGASISEKHANFIQLDPDGSSDDVKALIEAVGAIVEERRGIQLTPELRQVGFS